MTPEIQARLQQAKKNHDSADDVVAYAMFAPLIIFLLEVISTISTDIYPRWQESGAFMEQEWLVGLLIKFAILLCWTAICTKGIYILGDYLVDRFFPPFVIDESDPNLLRLYGEIRVIRQEQTAKRILAIRPGYRLVDEAFKTYGCTWAAIPVEPGYLETMAGFNA